MQSLEVDGRYMAGMWRIYGRFMLDIYAGYIRSPDHPARCYTTLPQNEV